MNLRAGITLANRTNRKREQAARQNLTTDHTPPTSTPRTATSLGHSIASAISIVGTYSTVGVLLAPPFVGYVAHLFSLNRAFLLFVFAAMLLMVFSDKAFAAKSRL